MRWRSWIGVLGVGLALGSSGCRGLIAPEAVEELVPAPVLLAGRVLDAMGRPMSGELLFDNREYEPDPSRWLVYRIIPDVEGRFVLNWREHGTADFEIIPADTLAAPRYRILSVQSDAWASQLVYPLKYTSWNIDLPAGVSVTSGTIYMDRTRPRLGVAPTHRDHFTLEMDSTRTVRGWSGPGDWDLRAVFEGPDSESLVIYFDSPAEPDSVLLAAALHGMQPRDVSISWPQALPSHTWVQVHTSTDDAGGIADRIHWSRQFSQAIWPGQAPVPTGDATVQVVPFYPIQLVSRGGTVDVYAGHAAPIVLSLGSYWCRVTMGEGWPEGEELTAGLDGGSLSRTAQVGFSRSALFLVDASTYYLWVTDSEGRYVRQLTIPFHQNLDLTIDAPDTAAQP